MKEIVGRVADHLETLGIEFELYVFPPIQLAAIEKAEKKMGLRFPDQLRDFYLREGDGLSFYWKDADDYGSVAIPSIKDLLKDFKAWKELVLWKDNYDFPHVPNPQLAKKTYQKMKSWLPFEGEGEGDALCLDCASKNGAVVYHQHDWDDGGSGTNGHVVARDLATFIKNWGQVCFTSPVGLYWPATFTERGVSWTSRHFNEKYIIPKA